MGEQQKHCAIAVVYRRTANGKIEVLLDDVVSTIPKTGEKTPRRTVFPGGMQRESVDPIDVTLSRELAEETFLRYSGTLDQIYTVPVVDRGDRTKVDHVKSAFLIPFSECSGELRTVDLPDANDYHYPPYWEPIEEAGRKLQNSHQPILLAVMRRFGLL